MAKGQIAKNYIGNKIVEIFKNDFIKVEDKKIYVWADDGDGKVQIAISLTCPKDQEILSTENSAYLGSSDDEINQIIKELGL